jgi:hypothetical protein
MRTAFIVLIIVWMLNIQSCTGIVDQEMPLPGIHIRTASQSYSIIDTVDFTVVNSFTKELNVKACCSLTYWLEIFENNTWRNHSIIHDECVALCDHYIKIDPEDILFEQLPLVNLSAVIPGTYRIKIEYYVSGKSEIACAYSNSFKLTN